MNDLISRQAAIDAIRKVYPDVINSDYKDGLRIATDRAIYHVEQLPSAQPERIKGRWIEKPHVYGVAYCSLCDYELHTNDTNFCPNCGADMRGEQDDESRSNSNAQTDTRARVMGATDKSSGI